MIPTSLLSDPALCAMSASVLAEHYKREISNYRRGETYDDRYGLELFRRAILHGDQDAWEWLQRCFTEAMLVWLRRHPSREMASRFDSEENYVAQAFARFRQATIHNQRLEFCTLAAALGYLRASLNSVVLDTLRTYSRLKEMPLPESGDPGEPPAEDDEDHGEFWEVVQRMIPNARERRLAYLLFHCGLKPREVVRYCPQEFSKVSEIYHLRRNILSRLVRHEDQIRSGNSW